MNELYPYPLYRPQTTIRQLSRLLSDEQREGDIHGLVWSRAASTGLGAALAQTPWPEDRVPWGGPGAHHSAVPRLRGCFVRVTGAPPGDVAALAWGVGEPYPKRGSNHWGWHDWQVALMSARYLPQTPIPIVEWLLAENQNRADLLAGPSTSHSTETLVHFSLLGNAIVELAQKWPVGVPAYLCMPRATPEQIYRSLQFWVTHLKRRASVSKRRGGRAARTDTADAPRPFPVDLRAKVQEIPLEALQKLRAPGVLDILSVLPEPAMRLLHADPKFAAWLFKFPEADKKLDALLTPKPLLPQVPDTKYIRLGLQTILMRTQGRLPTYDEITSLATSRLAGLEDDLRNPQVNTDRLGVERVQELTADYLTKYVRP